VDPATQASVNAALSQLGTLPIDDHTPTAPLVLPATVGGEGSFSTANNSLFLYYGPGKDPSVTTTGNTVLATGVAGGQIIDTNTGALGDILIADGAFGPARTFVLWRRCGSFRYDDRKHGSRDGRRRRPDH